MDGRNFPEKYASFQLSSQPIDRLQDCLGHQLPTWIRL